MKKILMATLVAAAILFAGTPTITIGTGGLNGSYYPMGKDIETLFDKSNKEIEKHCQYNITVNAVEGFGSLKTAKLISTKKLNAGIVQMDVLMYLKRTSPGKYNDKKIKIIAGLHKESMHLLMPVNYKPKEPKSEGWGNLFSSFSSDKPVKLELSTFANQVIEASGGSVVSGKAISMFNNLNATVVNTKGKWSGLNPILIVAGQPSTTVQDLLDTGNYVLVSLNYQSIKSAAPFYLEDTLVYDIGGTSVEVPSIGVQALMVGKQQRSKRKNLKMQQLATCLADEEILGELSDRDDTNNNWDSVYDLNQKGIEIDWDMFPLIDSYGKK